MMAYKSKGMKAPRPEDYKLDDTKAAKDAPKVKPSMQHTEPSEKLEAGTAVAKDRKGIQLGRQSEAPSHKKEALPLKDAPPGVKGVNAGSDAKLPRGGSVGDTEV